ncbi:cation-translocating P-type ATPase [Solimonas soli]|uniref:cation-translocating P-type ATPase n=1 Tax=Solimonas soli TaxID=413479 RepID=UPI0004844D0F|nr:cation-translocating P-type ATPase [Solimonas soli]
MSTTAPDTSRGRGLGAAEAARRLAADGPNELERRQRRSALRIAAEVLREPMFRLLLAAGVIYLALGDHGEALLLLCFAGMSVAIGIWQSVRGERALEALRELGSPRAQVIRDGRLQRIPGRDLVCGDLVVLSEGDRVPADLRLLGARDLQADESLLTGESLPASKSADAVRDADASLTPADQVYAGTLVVRGDGTGLVCATGPRSEIGKIGRLLQAIEEPPSPLQRQIRRLVRVVGSVGLAVSLLVVLIHGLWRDGWLAGLLAGIALAMAMLPEEFPLVLSVFQTLGARRLAQLKVLTRRASAIEALGATTVLCTDKTGTLTCNRMRLVALAAPGRAAGGIDDAASPERLAMLTLAQHASKPEAVDPMDRALLDAARGAGLMPPDVTRIAREYGFRADLPAYALLWRDAGRQALRFAAKGAPETIAALCGLDATALAALRAGVADLAARGIRVLALADGDWPADRAPPATLDAAPLRYRGLIGFADPLRPGVVASIAECRAAGVRVVMVTGDHPLTASAIARQAGLATDAAPLLGTELAALDDDAMRMRLRGAAVCARIPPQLKLRIVEALKRDGEVVAMTGDGVNDAPSLRAAHIGVAMGGRGSDVAREAAALVLLDDDFSSLVAALRQGRRINDNLRKALVYIVAVHIPVAGLSLLPLLLGWPLILTPVHIVLLELLIDPVCSIAFEAEAAEPDLMRRPPRAAGEALLPNRMLAWAALQGFASLAMVSALYLHAAGLGADAQAQRTLAFTGLLLGNVVLIFVNRSFAAGLRGMGRPRNRTLWWVLALALLMLTLSQLIAPLRRLLGLGTLPPAALATVLAASLTLLLLLDLAKRGIAPRAPRLRCALH